MPGATARTKPQEFTTTDIDPATLVPGPIQVVPTETRTPARVTPVDLVRMAVESNADLDRLERLMQMQIVWEQREAERAFNEAFAQFKAEPLKIAKDKRVSFTSAKGLTEYDHATHYGVTTAIAAALAKHGLSHSWTTTQEKDAITVTCTLKHRLGHSISTSMTSNYDASGGKNAIQAIASAKTYLERYTLLAITGSSTSDTEDDDGRSASPQAVEGVLQGLLEELAECKDDASAVRVWTSGKRTLQALGDRTAYDEFKDAVVKARQAMRTSAGVAE